MFKTRDSEKLLRRQENFGKSGCDEHLRQRNRIYENLKSCVNKKSLKDVQSADVKGRTKRNLKLRTGCSPAN